MADLYDRLEEIQGITRVLIGDVEHVRPLMGERSIQAAVSDVEEASRRFYVRAIFALVEAVVEQHKQLLLDLAKRNAVTLPPGVQEAISERVYFVKDNGEIKEREQYLQLERRIRAVYRAAGEAFGAALAVSFHDAGWVSFRAALDVRDRITHPKTFAACEVDEDSLNTVDAGHAWFQRLNNEFVRIAREHRVAHPW